MPTFTHDIEFRPSDLPLMERRIICGGQNTAVSRLRASVPFLGGADVPSWFQVKPGSIEFDEDEGDLYATLMFAGNSSSFSFLCANGLTATVNLQSSDPFPVTVRFLPT
jgi:hypothetical protein